MTFGTKYLVQTGALLKNLCQRAELDHLKCLFAVFYICGKMIIHKNYY